MEMRKNPDRNAILVSTTESNGKVEGTWRVAKPSREKIRHIVEENDYVRRAYKVNSYEVNQDIEERPGSERLTFDLTPLTGAKEEKVIRASRPYVANAGVSYFVV